MNDSRSLRRNLGSPDAGPRADPSLVWSDGPPPGDYTSAVYDNASDLLPFAARFIEDGIARGERCLYMFDDSMPGTVAAALADQGVDVARATRHLALELVSAQRFGAVGPFDSGPLIEHLRGWAGEPGLHNFTGVRIAAEMTWACRTADADKAVMAFEALFDADIEGRALTGAGMYRRGRFGVRALRQLIRGHRRVLAPDHIYVGLSPMLQGLAGEARRALLDAARERLVPKPLLLRSGRGACWCGMQRSSAGRSPLVRRSPPARSSSSSASAPIGGTIFASSRPNVWSSAWRGSYGAWWTPQAAEPRRER